MRVRRFLQLVLAALREIFDEAPYARYLARTGRASSRAAYAEFVRERQGQRCKQPRCC
jgi:hypothetical protein